MTMKGGSTSFELAAKSVNGARVKISSTGSYRFEFCLTHPHVLEADESRMGWD